MTFPQLDIKKFDLKTGCALVLLGTIVLLALMPFAETAWADRHIESFVSIASTPENRLHLIERMTLGPTPDLLNHVKAIGIEGFIQEQLFPEKLAIPSTLKAKLKPYDTVHQSPDKLLKTYLPQFRALRQLQKQDKTSPEKEDQPTDNTQAKRKQGLSVDNDKTVSQEEIALKEKLAKPLVDAMQTRLIRAVESPRQLEEVMTDFWFNHFNVYHQKQTVRFVIGSYEQQAIRPHVLGDFRDLLGATAHHPAMLMYLDNWQNSAPSSPNSIRAKTQFKGLNENYARELMELHTLGEDGGYTQQDVVALARMLTGWGIPKGLTRQKLIQNRNGGGFPNEASPANYPGFYFDTRRHDNGMKTFLGKTVIQQGYMEGEAALDILAAHPSTARFLSYKLAQYFVSDTPPESLVQKLAQTYQHSRGNIRSVLNTLFHSSEFWDPQNRNAKFKTPYRYVIGSVRAAGIPVQNAVPLVLSLRQMEMPLYGHITPDGYGQTRMDWDGSEALSKRLSFVTTLAQTSFGLNQPFSGLALIKTNQADKTGKNSGMKSWLRHATPVNHQTVLNAYDGQYAEKTLEKLQSVTSDMKATLLLGAPERMFY
jgi:uncharacterized protein (DUF1800 family)